MVDGLGEVVEGGGGFCKEVLLVIVVGMAVEFATGMKFGFPDCWLLGGEFGKKGRKNLGWKNSSSTLSCLSSKWLEASLCSQAGYCIRKRIIVSGVRVVGISFCLRAEDHRGGGSDRRNCSVFSFQSFVVSGNAL